MKARSTSIRPPMGMLWPEKYMNVLAGRWRRKSLMPPTLTLERRRMLKVTNNKPAGGFVRGAAAALALAVLAAAAAPAQAQTVAAASRQPVDPNATTYACGAPAEFVHFSYPLRHTA